MEVIGDKDFKNDLKNKYGYCFENVLSILKI